MREGISGLLKGNGEFIECEYGNHYSILNSMEYTEREKCITFSSSIKIWNNDNNSAIGWNREIGITKHQYNWIIKNKDTFDNMQFKCFIKPLVEFGDKWIKIVEY